MSTFGMVLLFVALGSALSSFFTVQTAEVAIVTRFGQFWRSAGPGLGWKAPFIDRVQSRISLRVDQITLTIVTKTKAKANVFVNIPISVQMRVRINKARYVREDPLSDSVARPQIMCSRGGGTGLSCMIGG